MTATPQSFSAFEKDAWENPVLADKYDQHLSALTRQSIASLLDAARVGPGCRVLDVASGAGYVADAAARRGAIATGIDFAQTQVLMARRMHPLARFEQADAQALPFEPETFDAVVNAFGMCHLPEPDVALREAFRVLRKGGWFSFTVWDLPERAIGFGALYAAVRAHGALDVGLPVGPNFFLFSEAGHSTKALRDAGFTSPACTQVPQIWHMDAPDDLYDMVAEGTARAAAMLRAQTPAANEAIRRALRQAVAQYRCGDHYAVPMPAALAAAMKPLH